MGVITGIFSTQSARARILGWDWFRFNLDDGSDGFVIIHRDMQSGKPVTQYAVISEKGKKPMPVFRGGRETLRVLESKPRTFVIQQPGTSRFRESRPTLFLPRWQMTRKFRSSE